MSWVSFHSFVTTALLPPLLLLATGPCGALHAPWEREPVARRVGVSACPMWSLPPSPSPSRGFASAPLNLESASPVPQADIIRYNGYPAEVHHVTTADGYVLQVDRIPRPGARVVFLANQMGGSAASYLVGGKDKALGFLLHDAGFDVWLGNFRGTPFSLNHVNMSSSDDDFWKFGWHENGALDNPAMVEYVLARSGQRDLLYAAHSMGGTAYFVMASERPDLAARVRAAFLFAPVVFMTHTRNSQLLAVGPVVNETQAAATRLREHRRPTRLLERLADALCGQGAARVAARGRGATPQHRRFCATAGRGPHHFRSGSPLYIVDGATVEQLLHTVQLTDVKWPGFRKLNLGTKEKNLARYGSPSPPEYRLADIKTPVFLYSGRRDDTCTPEDQEVLRNKLRGVRRLFFSPNAAFDHYNFVRDPNIVEDMWKFVLSDMKTFAKL